MALCGPTEVSRTNLVVNSWQFCNPCIDSPPLQISKLSKFPNSATVFLRLHNSISYTYWNTHTEIPLIYLHLYLFVTREEKSSCPLICNHRVSTRSSTAHWFQSSKADHIYQLSCYTLVGSYFFFHTLGSFFLGGGGLGHKHKKWTKLFSEMLFRNLTVWSQLLHWDSENFSHGTS